MDSKESECVESTTTTTDKVATVPDEGTPAVEEHSFNDNKGKGVEHSSRRGQRFSGRNDNRNSTLDRRSFGGANDSFEQGNKRGNRDFDREQGHSGGRGRDFGNRQEAGGWSSSDYYREKLYEMSGPTHDLPPLDMTERKFGGRNKLYVGNLPTDMTEENFKTMFTEYGEICDVFLNAEKRFGFVVFDYHKNAEKAKRELDGKFLNNDRQLKIRFSSRGTTIKVSNLAPSVTNELLYHAFSVFGEIERAIVYMDDRGHSTGVGEIDFTRKKSGAQAVKECTEGCFFLTNSLRPCLAEFYEPNLDTDGYSDRNIQWRNEFLKDREAGPWLAKENSFEYQFGNDWKQLVHLFKKKEEALKKELAIEEEKLMARMEFVKFEYETEMLKKQLEERELYRQQHKLNLEKKERIADEMISKNVLEIRKTEEQIMAKFARHEEDMLLRQKEGNLFNQEERQSVSFYPPPNNPRWNEDQENYWQREAAPAPNEDANSQESRERNTFLEEPGQVWKRLDKDNVSADDLFQRRGNEMTQEEEYQQGWKRTWPENYHYSKRNRY